MNTFSDRLTPLSKYSVPVEPGRTESLFDTYISAKFTWHMRGGPPLTYGECAGMLFEFHEAFFSGGEAQNRNNHPFQAQIYRGQDLMVHIEVEKIPYENVMIGELPFGPDRFLRLHATVYPSRQLRREDVTDVLNQAINNHLHELDEHVSKEDSYFAGDVEIVTQIEDYPSAGDFTYSMLQKFFEDLLNYYQTTGRYVVIDDAEVAAEGMPRYGTQWLYAIRILENSPTLAQHHVDLASKQISRT